MQKNCLGYPVEFVEDVFGESTVLAETLRAATGSDRPRVLIVADMNVVQRTEGLGTRIGRYVKENGIDLAGSPVVISGGEKIKTDNLQSALKVLSAMLEAKLGRNDCVLAIGGGTLLDVAGYAAAQVRGGVRIVRLPTTPVAMLGAAFATYAAVDSANVKDALRVPSVPSAVIIDCSFAKTVLDGVWRAGIGEAIRIAMVGEAKLLKRILALAESYRNRDMGALEEIAKGVAALQMKKGLTPFALWSAHRLEAMSGYKLPHGYAVSIGIYIDSVYAVEKGHFKESDWAQVREVLESCGMLESLGHSQYILSQRDRVLCGLDAWGLSSGSLSVVVPGGLGKGKIEETADREVYDKVLKDYLTVASRQ